MDFKGEFPATIVYGNYAVSQVINEGRVGVFRESINHFGKDKRRALRSKLEFLLESETTCIPLTEQHILIAHRLLSAFTDRHAPKANFLNTWHDMLIGATADIERAAFFTHDTLLARHIADCSAILPKRVAGDFVIDFGSKPKLIRSRSGESKRYVNRNWTVHFRQARASQSSV